MKKIIIVLLVICIICLGCFALTACDKGGDKSDIPADGTSRVELVKVEYKKLVNKYNEYTFRLWYPLEWFINNVYDFYYKTSPEADYEDIVFYAEYLLDVYGHPKLIKPDQWIYFKIRFDSEPSQIYFMVEDELFTAQLNLEGTYKTA